MEGAWMTEYEKKWGAKTEPVPIVLYLEKYRIEGTMYRLPKMRVSDSVNQATNFIALKDAVVYPIDSDTPVMSKPFIAVYKHHIVFVIEKD
jgi:hypothetical protein